MEEIWSGRPCELAVALHARKSHDSIVRLCSREPRPHLIVALTGTDLYAEPGAELDRTVLDSLARADRLVALQDGADSGLSVESAKKLRVIHQSLPTAGCVSERSTESFEIVLLANLRRVKDPLLAARAVRALPSRSRAHVLHAGTALEANLEREAERENALNPRYTWLGALPRARALALLARAWIGLSTSRIEGGSNAITEALALGIPVLATRIPGNVGLLGEDHPGLYAPGDAGALADLIERAESEARFLDELASAGRARAWIAERPRERAAWARLLAEIEGIGGKQNPGPPEGGTPNQFPTASERDTVT